MIGRKLSTRMAAGILATLGLAAPVFASGEFIWPIGGLITSTWLYPNGTVHSGSADIAGPSWTLIGAGRSGNAYAYWEGGGCGNYSYLTHGAGYVTLYCHQVRWPILGGGQWVGTNQNIGYRGSTGWSTGPRVHYAIKRWGARLIIPGIWIGQWVSRGNWVPGTYWGLSGSAPAPGVIFHAKVAVGALNVRTGPSTGYGIVRSLGYGTVVNVYGTSGSWYKIIYGGYYRWIAGWLTWRV